MIPALSEPTRDKRDAALNEAIRTLTILTLSTTPAVSEIAHRALDRIVILMDDGK